MAIQSPNVSFSANDKRLIALLERLLLESEEETPSTNLRRGEVPLTDAEAHELVTRIDATLESQEFWQAAHLIELLSKGSREAAREVYLAGRARHGFSRIMSSNHYHSFLVRLGFEKAYVPGIEALDYEYFIRMEKRLYLELGIQPRVVELLERFLRSRAQEVDASRVGKRAVEDGLLIRSLKAIRPQKDLSGNFTAVWTPNRIAGALTLFADMTVMFTTRDWSVAGTMSAMAGAIGLTAAG